LLLQYARENYGTSKEVELYYLICQQYFEESVNINSDKVLQKFAADVGINHTEAAEYFTSEPNIKKLFADIQKTKKKGILGVPHFLISLVGFNDSRPLQTGGQDKTGFLDVFQKLLKDYQKQMKSKK
jgi:Predicted dithiol-disulfide isomerase involved in polyketide biosynthesis